MDKGNDLPQGPKTTNSGSSPSVVTFKDTNWVDHAVLIMDLSESSVRIETDRPIDPGFVWFNDLVKGHKAGMVVWCQPFYGRYRAVMRLVSLTPDEEQLVRERSSPSTPHRPHRSPEEIMATLMESMRKNHS